MQTSRQLAYHHIRRMIVTGELVAGARLLEPEIATAMGISRTPVREAIIQLEMEGVVEQVPRVGVFVKKPHLKEMEELFRLRELIEPAAAGWAAEHITTRQAEVLDRVHGQYKRLVKLARRNDPSVADLQPYQRLLALHDAALHAVILQASNSPRMMKIVGDFQILSHVFGHIYATPGDLSNDWLISCLEHGRIVRAMKRHDSAQAEHWMRRHLVRARELAIAALVAQQQANAVEQFDALPADRKFLHRLGESFDLDVVESALLMDSAAFDDLPRRAKV